MVKRGVLSLILILAIFLQLILVPINAFDMGKGNYEDLINATDSYKVWSTPTTVNYKQNQIPSKYVKGNIDIEAAKGESESAQIIITPTVNVSSYNVVTSDLIQGNNTISKNNIKVYRQYYLGVVEGTNTVYYPDALIPIQKSFDKGENTISANNNQGLWFTINIPSNTMSGIYTATFTVSIDNVNVAIPVKVKVYNFAISKEAHIKTAFALNEIEEPLNDLNYSKYYNFFQNYRITTTNLPIANVSGLTLTQYAKKAKEYIIKPEVSSFAIPYLSASAYDSTHGNYYTVDYTDLEARIRSLCVESTDNENIMDKAFLYFSSILDEPASDKYWLVKDVTYKIEQMKSLIASDTSIFPVDGSKNGVKNSLLKLRDVVTTHIRYTESQSDPNSGNFIGYVNTWCPTYNAYSDAEYRYQANLRQQAGDNMWWYGCVVPSNPHPSFHMNGSLLPAREALWMQKDLNIEGLLYWSTTLYKAFNGTSYVSRDVWTDPMSWPDAPGDGMLVYPGTRYNSSDPLPTLRLENIRDGIEDYEYLWTLEQEVNKANQKYGTNIKLNDYISKIYKTMFTDADISNGDSYALINARKEIAMLIEALQSKSNALVLINEGTSINNVAIKVYANSNSTVYSDEQQITTSNITNGVEANFNIDLNDYNNGVNIDVINSGEKSNIIRNIGNKNVDFITFNSSNIQTLSKSDYNGGDGIQDVSISLNTNSVYTKSGTSLKVQLIDLPTAPDTYRQNISIPSSLVTKPFSKAQKVEFWVYNDSSVGERIYLSLFDNIGEKEINYKFAYPNSWTYVSIDLYSTLYGATVNLDQVSSLELSFKNSGTLDSLLYIDQIKIAQKSISSFDDPSNYTTNAAITASTDYSVFSSGISSLKLQGGNSSFPAIEYNSNLNIVTGKMYKVSFKVKAANSGSTIFLRLDNRGLADTSYAGDLASWYQTAPLEWTTFSKTFTATSGTYKLRIIQDRNQIINIDDLMIDEVKADSDFENALNYTTNAAITGLTDYSVFTSGKSSLKLTGGNSSWPAIEYTKELNIVAGKRYRVSFNVKALNSGSAIFLRLDNRGLGDTSYAGDLASWYETAPQVWTYFSKEFTATTCTSGNTYKLRIIEERSQTINIDNFLIEEIVPDIDFENSLNYTTNAAITTSIDYDVFSSGKSSLKLEGGNGSWPAIEYSNKINLVEGKRYRISFNVKALNSGSAIFLRLDNRGLGDTSYAGDLASWYETAPQTWTLLSKEFTATACTGANSYKLRIIEERSQTINIDNIVIEEIQADTTYENSLYWSRNSNVPTTIDYTNITSGKTALKIDGGSGSWPAIEYLADLGIVAGKTYRVSFKVKAANSGSAIFLRLDNRGLGDASYAGDLAWWYESAPQQWTTFTKDFTATACTGENIYKLRIIQDRSQTIYLDDFKIIDLTPDSNYENSSNYTTNAAITTSTDYDDFTSGKTSLKLNGGNGNWPAIEYTNSLSIVVGKTYRISFKVKAVNSGSAIFLRLDNRGLGDTSYAGDLASFYESAPQQWTTFTKDFTATAGTYKLRIIMERTQIINIDDLTIVPIPANGVTLNQTALSIAKGATSTITATVNPSNADNKSVTWSSNNTSVATVDSSGIVSGVAVGATTITCSTIDGGFVSNAAVTVTPAPVTGISLDKSTMSIVKGTTGTLTTTVNPTNADNKTILWTSSNPAIATFDCNGIVTGVGTGTATITATTEDGGFYASCNVTVTWVSVTGVTLDYSTITIGKQVVKQLTATVSPSNANDKSVTWSSNNTSVATVSTSGLVTAVAVGTAIITVTTVDAGKTATCTVTVKRYDPARYYKITYYSGSTLAMDTTNTGLSGVVKNVTYSGANSQQWQIIETTDASTFKIVNRATGYVLNVNSTTNSIGKNIIQSTYANQNRMNWTINDNGTYVQILSKLGSNTYIKSTGATGGTLVTSATNTTTTRWVITLLP